MFPRLVERRIEEAMRAGAFDGLPGRGRPLRWEDESGVPEEWRLAFRILRSARLAPAWVDLDGEIRAEAAAARRQFRSEHQSLGRERARNRLARRLADLNRKISDLNLMVPHARFQRRHLDPGREGEAAFEGE
jgi:hypothetical protein